MADKYIFTTEGHGHGMALVVWRGSGANFTDRVARLVFSSRVSTAERRSLIETLTSACAGLSPEEPLLASKPFAKKKAVKS